ncbi:ribonuclease H-like domain-containing protein, partial [Tanacetum coccineum]
MSLKRSYHVVSVWAEAVNTACYVLNRVLVTKPQLKTPYEILSIWYPKDSPFHLEAFSDSDYAGDNHDR